MILDVPVTPDAGDAHDWITGELARPEYAAARPSWFDRLVSGFWDWVQSLVGGATGAPPAVGGGLVLLVILAALVAAWLVFGPPRLGRRSTSADGALFGVDDGRSAADMRAAAERAAADADWAVAIEEMFRACARGLSERAVVTTSPGTTANGFAVRARGFFPALGDRLAASATSFDGVRYLGRSGSAGEYDDVARLDRELRATRPRFDQPRFDQPGFDQPGFDKPSPASVVS